jgi:hypothetical protein
MDFKFLKKLESLPPSALAKARNSDERLLVLVKLRKGASRPLYIVPRAQLGPEMFSSEILARDLERIESDPAVESVSVSQALPLIK